MSFKRQKEKASRKVVQELLRLTDKLIGSDPNDARSRWRHARDIRSKTSNIVIVLKS